MGKFKYNFLTQIDIFGVSPLFTIRGRPTFQTKIGSMLTIFCIVLIMLYLLFFLREMIYHKNPNLQSTIYYDEIPPDIYLTKNNFSFAFSLQNKEYISYIDESIYNVNAIQKKMIFNINGTYQIENYPLTIIKCNEYNFNIIPELFKKLPLNNLYCLNSDFILKGDFMKDYWHYIQINFTKCENETYNNKCKSEEEINELLNGGYLGIFFPDYSFEPNKYNKPYKTYVKNIYKSFSIKYYEDIFLYLKLVEIITDSGYFFEKKKTENFSTYDFLQNEIDYRSSKSFLSLNIRDSSKREIHHRSYVKIQTIFSNVGGMLKIVLLIGEYSVYFIRMLLYKNYILEFFNLDESEIRLKKIRKKYKLSGAGKYNIENIFHNLSNNTSFNNLPYFPLIKKSTENKNHSCKNIKIGIQEDKSFNKKSFNEDSIINKLSPGNINKKYISNKLVHNNNYFLKGGVLNKEEKKKRKITKSLIYRGSSLVMKNINNKENQIKSMLLKDKELEEKRINFNYHKPRNKISTNTILFNNDKNNDNSILNKQRTKKINLLIPKIQLRIIKVPSFCSDFICKKDTFNTIKEVHENYKEIQFLLDIVHYLKSQNELNIIGKYLFTEEQRKALSYTYTFETDFGLERKGYEYMIKHKKNKFDEKENFENSGGNLLSMNKNDN